MKRYRVKLTDAERKVLRHQINSGKYKNTRLRRAQILLGADESEGGLKMTDQAISAAYGTTVATVERTRCRFIEEGFELALHGRKRPVNSRRKIDGEVESHLIALRCSDPPAGASSWTLRLLADRLVELGCVDSISRQGVSDALKKLQSSRGGSNLG